MKVQIPYGYEMLEMQVPDSRVVGSCSPRPMPPAPDPGTLLSQAIQVGLEGRRVAAKAGPTAKACIVVTDRARSTPSDCIVPILLDQLNRLGVPDRNITVISGGGMHAADSRADLLRTLGRAVLGRVEVVTNEPDNDAVMRTLGVSDIGTPVELHRRFAEADIKIGVINVNPCMLAGWSGGGKIVQPAIASRRSIYHNHKAFVAALMELRCASLMGVMPPHNPVRADIEQCATISGIDMVVNTVLDSKRQLVDVFCGDHIAAHRAAVARMAPHVEVSLPQAVDVLVAGVGDPALEVSLFQGGSRVCGGADRYLRPGGTLVMVNACEEGIYEGFEHEEFREWMRRMPTPSEIGQLVEDGEMGGEKGCVLFTFSWLLHEMKCRIIVVTHGMTPTELKEVHLDHASSLQQALDEALSNYANAASLGIMPHAGLVLPLLQKRQ
jgi:nickel-dependent lactate racemase